MFGTWIGWIVKTFEYINRVDKRFRLRFTRVHGQYSPLSLLCITMILCVRRKILELLRSPAVASEPRFYALMLYARVEHK